MPFSVTITTDTISELRAFLDKMEEHSSSKEDAPALKPKVAVSPVKKEEAEVEKTPLFIGRTKKEKAVKEDAPAPEKTGLLYIDVKKATVALATENADKVREVLGEFGVTTATALKEEQWAEYVDRLKEELSALKSEGELA